MKSAVTMQGQIYALLPVDVGTSNPFPWPLKQKNQRQKRKAWRQSAYLRRKQSNR